MLRYSCNNITIVTDVIVLELCSVRFVHLCTTIHFLFFKQELEHKNKESQK